VAGPLTLAIDVQDAAAETTESAEPAAGAPA
jgi:hypothetical protein